MEVSIPDAQPITNPDGTVGFIPNGINIEIIENETKTGFIAEMWDAFGPENSLQIALDDNNNNVWVP